MAINIEAMRAKLNASKNGGKPSGNKSTMWRPKAGDQMVRILPTKDGDPFREFHFHYNVGKNPGIYCIKRNDSNECPICDFASKLWRDGVENDDQNLKNEAKKLFARKRYYSPVLVRGNESDGVKIWAYGKTAYETLLGYVLDPDYGDITDPQTGTDIKLTYTIPGTPGSFPKTALQPRRRPSRLLTAKICWTLFLTLIISLMSRQLKKSRLCWMVICPPTVQQSPLLLKHRSSTKRNLVSMPLSLLLCKKLKS